MRRLMATPAIRAEPFLTVKPHRASSLGELAGTAAAEAESAICLFRSWPVAGPASTHIAVATNNAAGKISRRAIIFLLRAKAEAPRDTSGRRSKYSRCHRKKIACRSCSQI
jgi:hypothetical protein